MTHWMVEKVMMRLMEEGVMMNLMCGEGKDKLKGGKDGKTVSPTALLFLDSDKLGSEYKNDMFVGYADGGRIFHFNLNNKRDGLVLKGNLTDRMILIKQNLKIYYLQKV